MEKTILRDRSDAVAKVLKESPLVILCGGHGTRLREETEWKPKPMVTVGDWPILWHIMRYYSCFGVNRFILCLGYKGHMIREFFLSYHERWADVKVRMGHNDVTYSSDGYVGHDWEVVLANTGIDAKTGTRVKAIQQYIDTDNFFLTYGDGLSDVNLNALVETHLQGKRAATVTAVQPVSRFGELIIEKDAGVSKFFEKPVISDVWINAGFFVFNRRALAYLPETDHSFEETALDKLAAAGELSAYKHTGFWQCVDTYRELLIVENLWNSSSAPWKLW